MHFYAMLPTVTQRIWNTQYFNGRGCGASLGSAGLLQRAASVVPSCSTLDCSKTPLGPSSNCQLRHSSEPLDIH